MGGGAYLGEFSMGGFPNEIFSVGGSGGKPAPLYLLCNYSRFAARFLYYYY